MTPDLPYIRYTLFVLTAYDVIGHSSLNIVSVYMLFFASIKIASEFTAIKSQLEIFHSVHFFAMHIKDGLLRAEPELARRLYTLHRRSGSNCLNHVRSALQSI